jgi:hypothetical protein
MTEKKRIALADIVESGMIGPGAASPGGGAAAGPAPEASDPVVQLVEEANRLLPNLPADRQREMSDVLGRLHGARATNDTRNVAVLVAQLTMLLVRGRGA